MKVSLKAKLIGLISLLLVVVLAISMVYLRSFVHQTLRDAEKRDQIFLDATSSLVQAVPRTMRLPPGTNREDIDRIGSQVQQALRDAPRLSSEMQLAVAFAPSVDYIAVTDPQGFILAHNNPDQIGNGQKLPPARPLGELLDAGPFQQLLILGMVAPAILRYIRPPLDRKVPEGYSRHHKLPKVPEVAAARRFCWGRVRREGQ